MVSFEPPPADIIRVATAAVSAYAAARDLILTLKVGLGLPTAPLRADDNASAFPYQAVLRLTFGTDRAGELAYAPKRDVQELAPKPFDEVFGEIPDDVAKRSFALSVLGPAGVVLVLAVVIAAAVSINAQRLQSQAPTSTPSDTQRPNLPDQFDTFSPKPPSNLRLDDVPNQAAPNRAADPKINEPSPGQLQELRPPQGPLRNSPSQRPLIEQRGPKAN